MRTIESTMAYYIGHESTLFKSKKCPLFEYFGAFLSTLSN